MPATWEAGTITVPSSSGSVSVTGLGGQPQLVLFYGANWLTEDSSVSTTGTALFRGMAAPKYDAPGTILQSAAVVGPTGDQHAILSTRCLVALTTAGTATGLYEASFTSFNSDGFTVNFVSGAAGGYKVVWCAMYDTADVGAFTGSGNNTFSLGWKAGSMLLHGASFGPPSFGHGDRAHEFWGGAAYPGLAGGINWFGAGLCHHAFPALSGQYASELDNLAPGTKVTTATDFIGPALTTSNVTAIPTGGSLTDFQLNPNVADTWVHATMWDDEDSKTGRVVPPASTGGTSTVSLPFEPGLVIGYALSDEPDGQGSAGVRGALAFSVATKDFQWAAVVDGVSTPRTSWQSFQRGFVDTGDGGNVHAGTVTLGTAGFTLETFEDDTAANDWVWHAFGHPRRIYQWIPHIYRMVVAGRSASVTPAAEYLLLEGGDRLLLEDGSGALIL